MVVVLSDTNYTSKLCCVSIYIYGIQLNTVMWWIMGKLWFGLVMYLQVCLGVLQITILNKVVL